MIETQRELTQDAVRRGYKPEAIVITVAGRTVQITSWPWFEDEGEYKSARIMARLTIGDPMSNREIRYFEIMKHTGQSISLDEMVGAK